MRSNVLPSSAPTAAVRPQRLLVLCRGAACPAQASTLASTPAFLARPAPSASGCSRHSLLVANAVRADQAAPSLSQDTLELISRLTQQVDDTHTDILRRSASPLSAGLLRHCSAQELPGRSRWVSPRALCWAAGAAAAAEVGDPGPGSELKQRVLATVRDVQQGLLERETEARHAALPDRERPKPVRSGRRARAARRRAGAPDDLGGARGRAPAAARPARHGQERALAPPGAPHGRPVL